MVAIAVDRGHAAMNLRTLRYFVAVAEGGSLSAAANAIPIAQPALSRQMRDLETELGVQLLVRKPRGVLLTPAGATLFESAQRILAENARMRERLSRDEGLTRPTVSLGAPPTLAGLLLPGLFENYAHTLKGIDLRMREAFTPALLEWLERGVIDMAVVTNPEAGRPLAFRPVLAEPFALFANKSLELGRVILVKQLAKIPLLLTSLHRSIIDRQLLSLSVVLQVHSEINSVDAIREIVSRGPWATIMPVSVFKDRGSDANITMAEISGVQLNRQLTLATRLDSKPTPAQSLVRELVDGELTRLSRQGVFSFTAPKATDS
jgi:LysR family nitrogen assimilation transcriptional regulator